MGWSHAQETISAATGFPRRQSQCAVIGSKGGLQATSVLGAELMITTAKGKERIAAATKNKRLIQPIGGCRPFC
jgi:hypothetical protein